MRSNPVAASIFAGFVLVTLVITYWSNRRSAGTKDFYAAGGMITARQNGLAIAGDYLSAASFLGTIAVFFSVGVSGLLYVVGGVAGWPIAMFLIGERLRNLGRYTFSDALAYRLADKPVRILAAASTLCITFSYLIAQMVGAGTLVQVLFNIPYAYAVVLVGTLMMGYVIFGGMLATTWIQVVKATLLLLTTLAMVVLALRRFGLDLDAILGGAVAVQPDPVRYLRPGQLVSDPVSAISLGIAFALGPAGLPHVLMRFFTVKDARSARRSLSYATAIIAVFQLMVAVLGYAAAALLPRGPLPGGVNMAAIHLAGALGGEALLGVTAAVVFATILAVVSGLMLAGASAVSHDLYKHVLKHGQTGEAAEIRVSRIATVLLGGGVIGLAIVFQHENIGFLATLPLVIAASVNFPTLVLAMHWNGLTTRGAVAGGFAGLVVSIVLLIASNKVWMDILGHHQSLFPYEYPTLFSLSAALSVAFFVSVTDRSSCGRKDRLSFQAQLVYSERAGNDASVRSTRVPADRPSIQNL
ncbi:MAG TPA: cation acetate symporter [Steroidobacteraceae bacterium]|nr:cation acetate symporter [Steroidobacteraceae bacterium]